MNSLFLPIVIALFSNNHSKTENADSDFLKLIIPVEASFNSIKIYNNINVYITEGEQNEIIVKSEEVADKIKFKVKDEVLIIKSSAGFLRNNKPVIIIKVKSIFRITIMGVAEVRTIGELSCDRLDLIIDGDGAIYASTKAREVTTVIKGVGKIEVRGNFANTSVNKDAYGNMVTTYN